MSFRRVRPPPRAPYHDKSNSEGFLVIFSSIRALSGGGLLDNAERIFVDTWLFSCNP